MKTELPERSLHVRVRLNFTVQHILELAQDNCTLDKTISMSS